MAEKDGGPAFPQSYWSQHPAPGMSLRQWYAGMAMQGIIASYANPAATGYPNDEADKVAKAAFQFADALLAHEAKEAP